MKFGVAKIIFLFFSLIFLFLVSSQDAKACEFGDCDLEPVDFNLQPDYPIMDEPLDINFTVVNNGAEPANNVSLIVWYSDSECDMQQETCEVIYETILMGVGDKGIQIEFDCTPDEGCTGSGDKVITVEVDYMDSISETDENNNKIILSNIRKNYKHIIIDEFQDNNYALSCIVEKISQTNTYNRCNKIPHRCILHSIKTYCQNKT